MPPAVDAPAVLRTDDPPVPDPVDHGDSMGILIVPSWQGLTDNAMPIVEGTSTDLLDRALAGHYPQTQQIGQVGNAVLAGHRRTHGDNVRHLDDLAPGDPVVIETATTWYVYQITSHEIVLPTQTDVLLPVPHQPGATPTQRLLTLTTCHSLTLGEYGNDHRWITYATFTGWMDRAAGTPDVILAMQDAVG
jgi:sortase A